MFPLRKTADSIVYNQYKITADNRDIFLFSLSHDGTFFSSHIQKMYFWLKNVK